MSEILSKIRVLLHEEQIRKSGNFLHNEEEYWKKLERFAKFEVLCNEEICKGVIAYYCDDKESRKAFITMVLVHPLFRGNGIGKMMMKSVLFSMKQSGFISCGLEVYKDNVLAHDIYYSLGFHTVISLSKDDRLYMEKKL